MKVENVEQISDIVAAFQNKFHSEDICRKALFQHRWPDGFYCPHCGHKKYYFVSTRNLYECKDCRSQTSLTAGTMMHNTNLPLQYWFFVIYLASEGIIFSARWLSKTLQINYRSAHRMLHAVRRAMRSQNGPHLLSSFLRSFNPESDEPQRSTNTREVFQRAKLLMVKRFNIFTRSVYRSVHTDFKQNYIDEFYFRWINRLGSRHHTFQKLIGACTVLHQ